MTLGKKAVVIEDSRFTVAIIRSHLEPLGFQVLSAGEGGLGLRMVKEEMPDIVILDLVLPGLSGENVCKEIRKDESTRNIPIIMLTAKGSDTDKVIGRVIGADVYMAKPFSAEKLAEEATRLTQKTDG